MVKERLSQRDQQSPVLPNLGDQSKGEEVPPVLHYFSPALSVNINGYPNCSELSWVSTLCLLRCGITGEKNGCFSVAAAGVVYGKLTCDFDHS